MPLDAPDHSPVSDAAPASGTDMRARVSAIAHDFNNLLTVINGYSDLLLKQLEGGDVREQVREIRQAGRRAAELNEQLLALVRPASEHAGGALPRAAAAPEPAHTLPPVRSGPSGSETILVVEDQPEVGRIATRVLAGRGYTVLNAGDAEEAIERAAAFDGPIHLLMTDMMLPGMNGRDLAARLHAVRPGLKVLYVSGYPQDHLVSQEWLSAVDPFLAKPFQPDALVGAVRAALDGGAKPATVLVVDDEEGVRKLLSGVLLSAGYEVVSAAGGREAQRIIQSRDVDLVLMDLVMPDREGIETIAALRRERPALKIIAISGFGGPFLQVARQLGARATLSKPISPDDLLRVARETLAAD
jgi:CheY-like chemotaxis protein